MNQTGIKVALTAAVLAVGSGARAAAITTFNFNTATGVTDTANGNSASGVAANMAATSLADSGLAAAGSSTHGYSTQTPDSSVRSRFMRQNQLTANASAAVTAGDYISFTLTPDSGYKLDLDTISVHLGASGNGAVATPKVALTTFAFLRSSLDSFANNIDVVHSSPQSTFDNASTVWDTGADVFTLGSAFDAVTTPVTFRLYLYGVTQAALNANPSATEIGDTVNRLDNLIVNGQVSVIPEPASLALAGLASVLLLPRRRNRPVNRRA